MALDPCAEPFTAVIESDVVIIEGGGGIAATLTIDAAMASADNIVDQVIEARGRSILAKARSKHN